MGEDVRHGCLVLADISGYTAYLAGVELEHSHDILADLLGVVSDRLCPPLQLSKLEGDAVFCVAEDGVLDAQTLVQALHRTYLSFARRRRTMGLSSSCRCDACRRTPELDLKFCVHHGAYVEHLVAGRRELLGPDVIVAHRLLKNSVTETHGLRGYAFLSDACARALEVSTAVPHEESYQDIGPVSGGLIDLQALWLAEETGSRTVVTREDADILFEAELDASQEDVWAAMTEPAHGMRWRVGVDDVRERNPDGGRGTGTVTHCVHGRRTIEQEIVDWLAPHHYTFRERNPAGLCMWTVSLAPAGDGRTHLEWRIALRGGRRQALVMRLAGGKLRRVLGENFDALLVHVRESQPL